MKLLLLSLFICASAFSQIVFLDINNNKHEKKAAIGAAKKAGKSIVVYPEDDAKFEKEKAFEILKKNPPETLFISGHDGGGHFGGDRGESFSKSDLEEFLSDRPEASEKLKVLGLLGCNTANHNSILEWKDIYPNLSFVAGYDGTAPAGDKPAGWNYIKDTILKTDSILKQTEETKIKSTFNAFRNIYDLAATLYVKTPSCEAGESKEFIFRPLRKGDERFKLFDTAECAQKRDEYSEKFKSVYYDYYSGEKEIPKSASSGDLRNLYTFMRQNAHCFKDFNSIGRYPDDDHLLFLLFYHDVKENFFKYYGEYYKELFDKIRPLTTEEGLKEYHKEKNERLDLEIAKLEHYLKDSDSLKKDYQEYIDKTVKENETNPPEKFLKECEEFIGIAESDGGFQGALYLSGLPTEAQQYCETQLWAKKSRDKISSEKKLDDLRKSLERKKRYNEGQKVDLRSEKIKLQAEGYAQIEAKSLEDLKGLSRKKLAQFTHAVTSMSMNGHVPHSAITPINSILYSLEESIIPFNWHDSEIPPERPRGPYRPDSMKKELNAPAASIEDSIFEDSYFGAPGVIPSSAVRGAFSGSETSVMSPAQYDDGFVGGD